MSPKILIADDEPNIVVSLEFMMKREGYEVLRGARRPGGAGGDPRASGRELVLLDAMMPRMTGFEVCEAVRADAEVARHADPDADRQGPRDRLARGHRRRRRRLRHQAVLDPRAGAEGPGPAGVKLDRRLLPGDARCRAWRSAALAGARRRAASARRSTRAARGARAALDPLVATHGMLPVLWWLVAAALAAWAAHRLYAGATSPRRPGCADATRVLVGDAAAPELRAVGQRAGRAPWPQAINGLAQPAARAAAGHGAAGGRGEPQRGASSATSSAR